MNERDEDEKKGGEERELTGRSGEEGGNPLFIRRIGFLSFSPRANAGKEE